MKLIFTAILVVLLYSPAIAQGSGGISSGDLGSGRFADFVPVELFTVSAEQMDQVASEDELVAVLIKQGDNSLSAARGYSLYASQRGANCGDLRTHCVVVNHEEQYLTFPFGFASAGGLGSTRVHSFTPHRQLEVSRSQLANIANDRELNELLTVDGVTILGKTGTRLYSTGDSDCSSPRVACGVVFEVETTLTLFGIGAGN